MAYVHYSSKGEQAKNYFMKGRILEKSSLTIVESKGKIRN